MSDNVVSVQITGDASGYVDAMKQSAAATATSMAGVQAAVGTASAQARDSLGRFVGAAKESGDAAHGLATEVESLAHSTHESGSAVDEFVHHVRGMRQEAFLGNFMAKQIAEVGIASKGAAVEVTGLISAFALGSGTGLAIEGLKLLVKGFQEFGKEVTEANEKAEASTKAFKHQVDDMILSIKGATAAEKLRHAEIAPLEEQELEQKRALYREYALLFRAQEDFDEAKKAGASGTDLAIQQGALDVAKGRVETEQQLLDIIKKQIKERGEGVEKVDEATKAKEVAAALDKEAMDAAQWRAAQLQEWRKFYEAQTLEATKAVQSQMDAADKEAMDEALLDAARVNEFREHYKKMDAETAKWANEQLALDKKQTKDFVKDFAAPIGSAFASTIKGMLLQGNNFGDAMIGMFKGLAGAGIDGLVKVAEQAVISNLVSKTASKVTDISETQGNIAVAATGAAASVADVPFIGPALAAAAAADMVASLEALSSPLLSARGGMTSVPSDGMLFELHKKEMVLDAPIAEGARNLFASFAGGQNAGGGRDVHLHISTMDARSFKSFLRDPQMRRAVQDLMRTGEWG